MASFLLLTLCDYVLDEYAFLFLMLGMMVVLSVYPQAGKRRLTALWVALVTLFVLSLVDYFEFAISEVAVENVGRTGMTPEGLIRARTVLSMAGYIIRAWVIWAFYIVLARDPRRRMMSAIPAALNTIVYLTALWSDAVIYFTPDNHFHGGTVLNGALRFTVFFISAIYCVMIVIRSAHFFRESDFEEGMLVLICTIACFVSGWVESMLERRGLIVLCLAFSLVFYFLFLYVNSSKRDLLTDLLNRQTFYQDSKRRDSSVTAVISIDMNELKYLNDTYGHEAGDAGIIAVASAMMDAVDPHVRLYRVGGDEFIALAMNLSEEDVAAKAQDFRDSVTESGYSCAVGYAFRKDREQSLDSLVSLADEAMYAEKAEMKKKGVLHMR